MPVYVSTEKLTEFPYLAEISTETWMFILSFYVTALVGRHENYNFIQQQATKIQGCWNRAW